MILKTCNSGKCIFGLIRFSELGVLLEFVVAKGEKKPVF